LKEDIQWSFIEIYGPNDRSAVRIIHSANAPPLLVMTIVALKPLHHLVKNLLRQKTFHPSSEVCRKRINVFFCDCGQDTVSKWIGD